MSTKVTLDYSNVSDFVEKNQLEALEPDLKNVNEQLMSGTGDGSEYLGWLDLPEKNPSEIPGFDETVNNIREKADALICIGIGGSYLGARAVIQAIAPNFASSNNSSPEILYAGQNIDSEYLINLLDLIKNKECYVNVISKSGTTTEPSIAFRVIRAMMEKVYGRDEAIRRIIATTDKSEGALRKLADEEGYTTFVIPDDVGGRFSVLTPVGLFPIAVAGCNVVSLLKGAADMAKDLKQNPFYENIADLYAAIRFLLYQKEKQIEILANFNTKLYYFSEWWKQLFGESEGKQFKGIFPSAVNFTTDLHSLGQYIQEGNRNLFETFLIVNHIHKHIMVPNDNQNLDGLNYLAGKTFQEINFQAYRGTAEAHLAGAVPNMTVYIPELTEYWIGNLIFFFEKAVALSGYLLGVNPFNQPGVEAYKNNMFRLLGKPGVK